MSDYTKTTNFTAKDSLSSGDPDKLIKGSLFDTEFDAIATAIATKYDTNDLASQAQAEAGTSNTVLMTPLRTEQWSATWAAENAGIVGDLQALADPNADRLLGWDDSAGAAIGFALGTGLETSGTNVQVTLNELTTETAIAAGDFIAMVDITDSGSGKITFANFEATLNHDSLTGFVSDEHVAHSGVTLTAGNGLTGGGTIAASRSFAVGQGDGISVTADAVAVDSTVVRTTGTQTIGGAKTFSADAVFQGSVEIQDDFVTSGVITNSSTGTLDNVSTTDAAAILFTGAQGGTWSITGLAGGTSGRRIVLINQTGSSMTLADENSGSTAANRIQSYGTARTIVDGTAVELIYDGTASRWVVLFGF